MATADAMSRPEDAGTAALDRRRWRGLVVMLLAAFMDIVNTTVVLIAAPTIRTDLGASHADIQWVVAAYALALGLVLATVQVSFPPAERPKAYGAYGAMNGLGAAAASIIGGLLVGNDVLGLAWRSVFWINVPVGLVGLVAGAVLVAESRSARRPRLDLLGVVVVSVGLLLLLYPLIHSRTTRHPTGVLAPAVDPPPPTWWITRSRPYGWAMVRTLLLYVLVCAIPVAVFWLAGRLLGLSRPFSGPTGRAWLDAEDAFDQARRRHQRHRLAAALHRQPHRLDLPTLREAATLGLGGSRNAGEQEILLRDIVGATDGADGKFDRDFLPTDERSRWRFQAVAMALREGRELPPIEVYRLHGRYYVADGHHRVAAARALGETSIAAYVTDISG